KSLGNFFTLRDLLDKGYTGREIRYVLLSAQYRQSLNFTFDALAAARTALARVDECVDALNVRVKENRADDGVRVASQLEAFGAALGDDLNAPEAFAAFYAFIRAANSALSQGLSSAGAQAALDELNQMDRVLGFVNFGRAVAEEIPAEIQALADARAKARAEKNWAESDRLRDELAAQGWQVRDSKDGQTLKPLAK
ncbi:MAG: cysteine--tRNA ligase, partial [bacterium]|nr:cysteine--tRNA ligase [bacterium]